MEHVVSSLNRHIKKGTTWLTIEPNAANPYVFVRHALETAENNFWPGRMKTIMRQLGWKLREEKYLFVIPPPFKALLQWFIHIEPCLEPIPFLAGGIAQRFEHGE